MPKVWKQGDPNIPTGAILVDRTTKWGNPYVMRGNMTRQEVITRYRNYLAASPYLQAAARVELRGRDLVCHCAPKPCHADILLEIANG